MQRPIRRTLVSFSAVASVFITSMLVSVPSYAASDPGVRGGAAGAGQPFANLTTGEAALFNGAGRDQFEETEDVPMHRRTALSCSRTSPRQTPTTTPSSAFQRQCSAAD